MEPPELQAELASEHHDRITEAEHEAEQAAERAEAAVSEAFDVRAELTKKADAEHDHPQYVRHEELEERISGVISRADEAARQAEEAAQAAEAEAQAAAGPASEPAGDELPLPEPEPEPIRYERRHGRYHQRRAG